MGKISARKVLLGMVPENSYGIPPIAPATVVQQLQSGTMPFLPIPIIDFSFSPQMDTLKRTGFKPSLSPTASLISKVYTELSFTTELDPTQIELYQTLFPIAGLAPSPQQASLYHEEFIVESEGSQFSLNLPVSDDYLNFLNANKELSLVKIHIGGSPLAVEYSFGKDSSGNLQLNFVQTIPIGATIEVYIPEENSSTNAVLFKPTSSNIPSATFYLILDNLLFTISGASADLTISFEANNTARVQFKVKGNWSEPIKADGIQYSCSDIIPPLVRDTFTMLYPNRPDATYGGLIDLAKAEISLNNEISQVETMNAIGGVGGFFISARDTQLSIDGDMLDDPEFYNDVLQGQDYTFLTSLTKKDQGYIRLFTKSFVPSSMDFGDRNGIRTITTKGSLVGCDDELTIFLCRA